MKFLEFRTFWSNEIEKKLFRYSKEFGFYSILKEKLGPKEKSLFIYFFTDVRQHLLNNDKKIIVFTKQNGFNNINRTYSVYTALNSNRHLSQIIVFNILRRCSLNKRIFMEVFEKMDKEIFKGHRAQAFFREKYDLVKTFFK